MANEINGLSFLSSLTGDQAVTILVAALQGRKIEAIKRLRECKGLELKDSKDIIESALTAIGIPAVDDREQMMLRVKELEHSNANLSKEVSRLREINGADREDNKRAYENGLKEDIRRLQDLQREVSGFLSRKLEDLIG